MVAAVTDDRRIVLWDVKHGVELKQIKWTDLETTGRPLYVTFAGGEDHGKGLRLMAAAGGTVKGISW